MWSRINLYECLEYMQQLKLSLGTRKFNENANLLLCFCFLHLFIFFLFYQFSQKYLKSSQIKQLKHRQTVNFCWNFIFYLCSTSFLILYHSYFIQDHLLQHEMGKWYPKRRSFLFFRPCDLVKFKIVTFILSSFNIVGSFLDFHGRDVSEATSKILFTVLLIMCYFYGYENYSIILNINLGLFYMFTELLSLLSLHSDKEQIAMFRVFVAFKFVSWIYIFLNLLPFQYMMPTLHAKDFKFGLCITFILWYISKIWTSPLLHVFYHQLYHLNASDCPGENSLARCLLLKDSPELHHMKNLRRAYLEVKLHNERHQLNKLNLSESAVSATTFQTIKCVMTLKRKLKRIRENRDQQHKN